MRITRFHQLRGDEDFDREGRREDLRDRRWKRRRSQLVTVAAIVGSFLATTEAGGAVQAIERLLGV